jgi:hypothetical protein
MPQPATGILERRPCVVLDVALPEEAPPAALRRIQRTLAGLAFDTDALFFGCRGHVGELIFGVQRQTEHDVVTALSSTRAVFDDIAVSYPDLAAELRGGLAAGIAVVSMKRFGGWSGEAIASGVIGAARELLSSAAAGQLVIGESAIGLMNAFGTGEHRTAPSVCRFSSLDILRWRGDKSTAPLIGREAEWQRLDAALTMAEQGHGTLIHLSGETGMGKSRLCREAAETGRRRGGEVAYFMGLPGPPGWDCYDLLGGGLSSGHGLLERLAVASTRTPSLFIVDDFHLLPKELQAGIRAAACQAVDAGRLVLLSGRKHQGAASPAESIHLGRLPAEAIEGLVRSVADKRSGRDVASIVGHAAGVPLFALELARLGASHEPGLPLVTVVGGRLDGLGLDRILLRLVAQHPDGDSLARLAAESGDPLEVMQSSLERAVAAGVLVEGSDGLLAFRHPLLRDVINYLEM